MSNRMSIYLRTRSNFLAVFAELVRGAEGGVYSLGVSALTRATIGNRKCVQRVLADMVAWGFTAVEFTPGGRYSPAIITITPAGFAFRAEALALLFPEAV